MQSEGSGSTAKVVTGIVVIAAIALIYFFSMGHTHNATAANTSSVSDTPLSTTTSQPSAASPNSTNGTTATNQASGSTTYKAGTYSATGNYETPDSQETITVDLAVASDGTVTDASVQQSATNNRSAAYQAAFKDEYKQYVVGKKLSDINLQYVSGASLTTMGFDQALEQIKTQATQG